MALRKYVILRCLAQRGLEGRRGPDSAIPVLGSGLLPGRELCSPLKRGEDFAEAADRGKRSLLRQAGPLEAQDEMIDPQDFAVTRDLFLDRHLVADDEAVARELLERRLLVRRAAALQPPGRIGVVDRK